MTSPQSEDTSPVPPPPAPSSERTATHVPIDDPYATRPSLAQPGEMSTAAFRDVSTPAVPVIPGYELESILGKGGMGVVYRARHLALKRTVALKMIRTGHQADADELARFRAEAEAVAQLQHPNIVQIFEVGQVAGTPFFVLEFVAGGTLANLLRHTPLAAVRAASLVQTLAKAIQAAHERGIIHRDLKPANVLLLKDGTPKITDFGLAKNIDAPSGQTQTGAILGTPSYMAPEQAGHGRTVGPAADVYALGAILYECLTGRPPFKGPNLLDTVEQVRTCEPVPPSRLQAKIPRDLETICLKCLQKDPGRRYASAAELADDLHCFSANLPIRARPVSPIERCWRWCNRNRTEARLLAALVAAIVLGGILVVWFAWAAMTRATEADQARGKAEVEAANATSQKAAAEDSANLAKANAQEANKQKTLAEQQEAKARKQRDQALKNLQLAAPLIIGAGELTIRLLEEGNYDHLKIRLEQLRDFVEKLAEEYPEHPENLRDLARTYGNFGLMHTRLKEFDRAQKWFALAIPLLEQLLRRNAQDAMAGDILSSTWNNLGVLHRRQQNKELAQSCFQKAVKQIEPFASAQPQRADLQNHLATYLGNLASEVEDKAESKRLFQRAVGLLEKPIQDHPDNLTYRSNLAAMFYNQAVSLNRQKQYAAAEPLLQKAISHLKMAFVRTPKNLTFRQNLGNYYRVLSTIQQRLERPGDAEATLREMRTVLGE